MNEYKSDKITRTLGIYTRLMNGATINKAEEAQRYGVNERSIQRDIDDIRNYLESDETTDYLNSVVYDRFNKGYHLTRASKLKLTNSEILAICKILLDSRAFTKDEMKDMLKRLIACCVPEASQALIIDLIRNEAFHYVELSHKTHFMDTMWDIGQAIRECYYIEMDYERTKDKAIVKRKVKPVAILFSEYYFYLTAFIEDKKVRENFDVLNDSFPTIYRIDRIKKLKVLKDDKFRIPYSSRFEEGEFRKRIQFMFGGKLQKLKFQYIGADVTAVLDRLPTATILSEEDGVYTITAEVFGKGIDMWLRSQGDLIRQIQINGGVDNGKDYKI